MPYVVTTQDIADRWRPLSAEEDAVAGVLLEDAQALLDVKLPRLEAQVAAGVVPERLVTAMLVEAVQRVLRNPDVQTNLQLGADGSLGVGYAVARATEVARPRLELTEADLALLRPSPAVPLASGGIYSIPLH